MRSVWLTCFCLFLSFALLAQNPAPKNRVTWHTEKMFYYTKRELADVFRVYSIKEGEEWVVRDYYLDGKLRGEAKDKNGMIHGRYVGYYKSGTVRDSGNYHKGVKWDAWKTYHENGRLCSEYNYRDDQLHGLFVEYDSSGNLIAKKTFKKGKMEGMNVEYYPGTQQIKYEVPCSNGKLEGTFVAYYPDGVRKRTAMFKEGKLDKSTQKEFNKEGVEVTPTAIWQPCSFSGEIKKHLLSLMHYPVHSLENNIQGNVYLRLVVDKNGRVKEVDVAKGVNEECNEEAKRIVLQLQFSPEIFDGEPRESLQRLAVPFFVNEFLKRQYINKEKQEQETAQEIEDNANPFR